MSLTINIEKLVSDFRNENSYPIRYYLNNQLNILCNRYVRTKRWCQRIN